MATPVFTKKTTATGQVQYRKDGALVAKDTIDEALLARLDIAAEGTPVPESAEVEETEDNKAPAPAAGKKLKKIHLERNHMVNGKVYRGGYEVETDPETNEVVSEVPIEIEIDEELAEELLRNDRNHTTYEKNLLRGQNRARVAPQVKDVKATD